MTLPAMLQPNDEPETGLPAFWDPYWAEDDIDLPDWGLPEGDLADWGDET